MNAPIRMAFIALAGGLATLGVFGLRFAYSPGDYQKFVQINDRREDLLRKWEAYRGRLESRKQAVREWIAQRRTLAETVQRFQELDREWGDTSAIGRPMWPGTEEEIRYQHIRSIVELLLQGRPQELAPVLRRLEMNYRQLQAGGQKPSSATTDRTERSR
jgi:hypothetical protein